MSRKNNKKSFSDNLETLFQDRMFEDNPQDTIAMLKNEDLDDHDNEVVGDLATKHKNKNKATRKSFSTNLEQFFKDSIEGVLDGVVTDVKRNIVGKGNKQAIGIDLLIKRTTTANVNEKFVKNEDSTKQRVTIILDAAKLEELKKIAKAKKQPLQQIIGELVADYVSNKYPDKKDSTKKKTK